MLSFLDDSWVAATLCCQFLKLGYRDPLPKMSDSEIVPTEATTNPTMDEAKNENGNAKTTVEEKETAADSNSSQGNDAEEKEQREEKSARNGPKTYEKGMLKTTATVQYDKTYSNSKYDPSVLKTSDDPKEIRGQVEFYFSDSNLPTDNYMMTETKGPVNKPISLKKIHAFGRMRRFQPYSGIVAALKDSKFLDVTGEEGEEMVSRKVAYNPNTPVSKTEARSVYVKGFGDEEPSSQFDIEAFFAQFGTTNAVRLRRTPEKLFKGSVFVEWNDEETAQKFLALDPQPNWKGKHVLQVMSKTAYLELKQKEIQEGTVQPSEFWGQSRGRGRGRGRGFRNGNDRGRNRGDRDPDDWKKRREEDRANGFKDDRNRNKGRGHRNDRGPRNNDRNRERHEKNQHVYPTLNSDGITNIMIERNPRLKMRLRRSIATRSVLARMMTERNSQPRRLIPSQKSPPKPRDALHESFHQRFSHTIYVLRSFLMHYKGGVYHSALI